MLRARCSFAFYKTAFDTQFGRLHKCGALVWSQALPPSRTSSGNMTSFPAPKGHPKRCSDNVDTVDELRYKNLSYFMKPAKFWRKFKSQSLPTFKKWSSCETLTPMPPPSATHTHNKHHTYTLPTPPPKCFLCSWASLGLLAYDPSGHHVWSLIYVITHLHHGESGHWLDGKHQTAACLDMVQKWWQWSNTFGSDVPGVVLARQAGNNKNTKHFWNGVWWSNVRHCLLNFYPSPTRSHVFFCNNQKNVDTVRTFGSRDVYSEKGT